MNQLINSTQKLSLRNQDNLSLDFHSYLNDIFKDSGFNIKTEGTLDTPYFNGKDLCRVLGFKDGKENIKTTLQKVPDIYKIMLKDLNKNRLGQESCTTLNYNEGKAIYLNKNGVIYLIKHSRLVNLNFKFINFLIDKFNLNLEIKYLSKQQIYINNIIESFSHLRYQTEYRIDNYKVDLFFNDYNLIIECDENNHSTYKNDKLRELYIKSKLNCNFIRFNPDKRDFSIFKIINKIHKYINKKDLKFISKY